MSVDPVVKASAIYDGREFNWEVTTPRRMMDDLSPLCNEVDKYILDHPGYKVTILIER